jgi:hypothetical protein
MQILYCALKFAPASELISDISNAIREQYRNVYVHTRFENFMEVTIHSSAI